MNQVAIVHGENTNQSLSKVFQLSPQLKEKINFSEPILIVFDFLYPFGSPATVNPNTLSALISFIQENSEKNPNAEKLIPPIYVLPAVTPGILSLKSLEILGLKKFIYNQGAIPLNINQLFLANNHNGNPLEDEKEEKGEKIEESGIHESTIFPNNLINQIKTTIFLTQIRTDPVWGVFGATKLIEMAFEDLKSNPNIKLNKLLEPSIVINDASIIGTNCCTIPTLQTQIETLRLLFIGSDVLTTDLITLEYLGIRPEKTEFNKDIKIKPKWRENLNIIEDGEIDKYISISKECTIIEVLKSRGVDFILGEMESKEYSHFLTALTFFHQIFFKDLINLGKLVIVCGRNLPDQDFQLDTKYLVIGNDTIKEVQNSKNCRISKRSLKEPFILMGVEIDSSKILNETELERALFKKERVIRDKIIKLRNDYKEYYQNQHQHQNDDDGKNNESLIELLCLEQEYKMELKIAKLNSKIEVLDIKIPAKNEMTKVKNHKMDLIMNPNICYIPGQSPIIYEWFYYLKHIWKNYYVPSHQVFLEFSKIYYSYPEHAQKDFVRSLLIKKKMLKKEVNARNKELKPGIKQELKKIKENKKHQIFMVKKDLKESLERLKNEFEPKIRDLQMKNNIPANFLLSIKQKSVKIINEFGDRFSTSHKESLETTESSEKSNQTDQLEKNTSLHQNKNVDINESSEILDKSDN